MMGLHDRLVLFLNMYLYMNQYYYTFMYIVMSKFRLVYMFYVRLLMQISHGFSLKNKVVELTKVYLKIIYTK